MHIRIHKDDLVNALTTVGKALPSRTVLASLEGIFMEVYQDGLHLVATDLQKGIETTIPAEVVEEGSLVAPGRLFTDICRRLPEEEIEILSDEKQMEIHSGSSVTKLSVMDAQEYPQLPLVEGVSPIIVPQNTLRDMIRQTAYAASLDETRMILTGVAVECEGTRLRMIALDGFRMAMRTVALDRDYELQKAVVPAAYFNEITRILDASDEPTQLFLTKTHLALVVGQTRFIGRLLEGEYIKYQQILPTQWQTRMVVDTSEFAQAVERAAILARESRNNLIRLLISQDRMTLRAESEVGVVTEDIGIVSEGPEIEIAFNSAYISDLLKNLDVPEVALCFQSNISPCVARPVEGEDFLYLVLPVRIYA
jgi:DNA polymerase-3 subunit beta